MIIWLALIIACLVLLFLISSWRSAWVKSATRKHLWVDDADHLRSTFRSRKRRYGKFPLWLSLAAGIGVFVTLQFYIPHFYAIAFSVLVAIVVWQLFEIWMTRQVNLVEEQLADMVDLMIGGLQAGSGPVAAMESAITEIGKPIGPIMSDVMGRLKLGDSPTNVFNQLIEQTDLETFKIFGASMAVHWETGGRLVPLLGTVAKMIRDRIEVMRNARLQSAQGKLSAIVFVLVTYILAYAVWRYDPGVMSSFITSPSGTGMMSFLIVLQAIGMVWIHRMTSLRY